MLARYNQPVRVPSLAEAVGANGSALLGGAQPGGAAMAGQSSAAGGVGNVDVDALLGHVRQWAQALAAQPQTQADGLALNLVGTVA